mgnify:CR=1 FL=1
MAFCRQPGAAQLSAVILLGSGLGLRPLSRMRTQPPKGRGGRGRHALQNSMPASPARLS